MIVQRASTMPRQTRIASVTCFGSRHLAVAYISPKKYTFSSFPAGLIQSSRLAKIRSSLLKRSRRNRFSSHPTSLPARAQWLHPTFMQWRWTVWLHLGDLESISHAQLFHNHFVVSLRTSCFLGLPLLSADRTVYRYWNDSTRTFCTKVMQPAATRNTFSSTKWIGASLLTSQW